MIIVKPFLTFDKNKSEKNATINTFDELLESNYYCYSTCSKFHDFRNVDMKINELSRYSYKILTDLSVIE